MDVRVPAFLVVCVGAGCLPASRGESRATVSGRVELAAVPGLNDMSRVRVDLGRGEGGITPDEDGQFLVSDLEPDVYALVVTYSGGLTPTATRSAYRRLQQRVVATAGGDVNVGTLRPVLATGTISGAVTLVDGQGADGARVTIVTAEGRVMQAPVVGGRFTAEDVPVGESTLTAGLPGHATAPAQDQCAPPVQVTQEDDVVESTPMVLAPTAVGLVPGAGQFQDTQGSTWYALPTVTRVTIRVLAGFASTGRVWRAENGSLPADGGIPALQPFRPDGYVVDAQEGRTTYLMQFADRCGYESPVYSVDVVRDSTKPVVALVLLHGGASHARTPTMSLKVVASDNLGGSLKARTALCDVAPSGERVCSTSLEEAGWVDLQADSTVTFPGGDGEKVVQVQVMDHSGNPSDVQEDSIVVDTTGPTGPTVVVKEGTQVVNRRDVTLVLAAQGATQVRVGGASGLSGVAWQPLLDEIPFRLAESDGQQQVFAQFSDDAGNTTAEVSTSVTLDTTPPSPPVVSVGTPPGSAYTTHATTDLHVTSSDDDRAVFRFRLWGDVAGGLVECDWPQIPTAINLAAGDGAKVLWASLTDRAGNQGAPAQVHVELDSVPPFVSSVVVNRGATHVGSRDLSVEFMVTDAREVVVACDGAVDTETWRPITSPLPCTAPDGDGLKRVLLMARDAAGNNSALAEGRVMLDTRGPLGSLAVADVVHTEAGPRVRAPVVDLLVTADDPVTADGPGSQVPWMKLWDGAESEPGTWTPLASQVRWTLSPGDGDKVIRLALKDAVGNVSTEDIRATVVLDTTPPTMPRLTPLPAATSGDRVDLVVATPPTDTLSEPVTLELLAPGSAAWTTATFPRQVILPVRDTPYVFRVRARDAAGNISAEDSVTTMRDNTPPGRPQILANAYVSGTSTALTLAPNPDDTDVGFEACAQDVVVGAVCSRTCTLVPTPANAALALVEGRMTCVFARAVDRAGNPGDLAVAAIVSDTSGPRPPRMSPRYEPGTLVVQATEVEFSFSSPAEDEVMGDGVTPYKGVAYLEVDDGAGFRPLCPSLPRQEVWRPCDVGARCPDPRLTCRGDEVQGVRVALAAGVANRVAVRAVDLAGNVGDGVGQVVVTRSGVPVTSRAADEYEPRLSGSTVTYLAGDATRVMDLGTNRRADPTDEQCTLVTNTNSVRQGAWPGPDGLVYVVDTTVKQIRFRPRTAQGVCQPAGDDPLVAEAKPGWHISAVARSGSGVAWVEERYDGVTWSSVFTRQPGPDGNWITADDVTGELLTETPTTGNAALGLRMGGRCVLWNWDPGHQLTSWHVACSASRDLGGPWVTHDFTADSADLSPDGRLLAWKTPADAQGPAALWAQAAVGGAFHAGDPAAGRGFPPGAEYGRDSGSVATDGARVVSLDSAGRDTPTTLTDWNAGGDGVFQTGDDVFRRMAVTGAAQAAPAVSMGLVVFPAGPYGVRDILAVDLSVMRWVAAEEGYAVLPVLDGLGTLVWNNWQGTVARAPDGLVTAMPGLLGNAAFHPVAMDAHHLLVAEEPGAVLHRPDGAGHYFTAGSPAPLTFQPPGGQSYLGAYLGQGKGLLARIPDGEASMTPVVLEPVDPAGLATPAEVELSNCTDSRLSYWGGISARHAIWDSGRYTICYRWSGPGEMFGDLPASSSVELSVTDVGFASLDGDRILVIPRWGQPRLLVLEAGGDQQFGTGDDVVRDIPVPGVVRRAAVAGDKVAYVATPDTGEGTQVFLHHLDSGDSVQLTHHWSPKGLGTGSEISLAVDPWGRTVWVDGVFPYPSILGYEP